MMLPSKRLEANFLECFGAWPNRWFPMRPGTVSAVALGVLSVGGKIAGATIAGAVASACSDAAAEVLAAASLAGSVATITAGSRTASARLVADERTLVDGCTNNA